jgi:hypothetical protein
MIEDAAGHFGLRSIVCLADKKLSVLKLLDILGKEP